MRLNKIEAFSKFYFYQILSETAHNEVKQLAQTICLIVLFMPMEAHKLLAVFLVLVRRLVLTFHSSLKYTDHTTHPSDIHIFILIFMSYAQFSVSTIQHIYLHSSKHIVSTYIYGHRTL